MFQQVIKKSFSRQLFDHLKYRQISSRYLYTDSDKPKILKSDDTPLKRQDAKPISNIRYSTSPFRVLTREIGGMSREIYNKSPKFVQKYIDYQSGINKSLQQSVYFQYIAEKYNYLSTMVKLQLVFCGNYLSSLIKSLQQCVYFQYIAEKYNYLSTMARKQLVFCGNYIVEKYNYLYPLINDKIHVYSDNVIQKYNYLYPIMMMHINRYLETLIQKYHSAIAMISNKINK
jgi:hypothetical protein